VLTWLVDLVDLRRTECVGAMRAQAPPPLQVPVRPVRSRARRGPVCSHSHGVHSSSTARPVPLSWDPPAVRDAAVQQTELPCV
jgi:hypothetical protein